MYNAKTLMVMGDNVRAIRQRKRMSLEALSHQSGLCVNAIYRIENNKLVHGGSMDIWLTLCNVLGCNLDDLTKDYME